MVIPGTAEARGRSGVALSIIERTTVCFENWFLPLPYLKKKPKPPHI